MSNLDADRLDDAVAEIVQHGHDDMPEGPPSPLGGEARPNLLKSRPHSEITRLAALGKNLVDHGLAALNSRAS